MKATSLLKVLFLFIAFFNQLVSFGQNDTLKGITEIRQLINDEKFEIAITELKDQIDYFKSIKNYDTLVNYIEFVGSYSLANKNWNLALSRATDFVNELKKQQNPKISTRALKELAWIYDETGEPNLSYKTLEQALAFANQLETDKLPIIADLYYNMGYYASAFGNYKLSKKHYFKSLQISDKQTKKDYVFYQQMYNAIGGIMWREGKPDSCNYYFKKSIGALEKTKSTPLNKYYRPALVNMNIAVISNMLGKNAEAVSYSEEALKGFQNYIGRGNDEQKKNAARKSLFATIDNLGVFYNTVGEFNKAEQLITYAYNEKKKLMTNNDPNIIISKIILAQAKINTQDLQGAASLLDDVLNTIELVNLNQFYWHSTALITRGKIYEQIEQPEKATEYYKKGENLFRKSLNGNYNDDFLHELETMGIFYAKNKQKSKAIKLAEETYNAIQKGDFKNTKQELTNSIAIAEIYYQLNEYKKATEFSEKAINFQIDIEKRTAQDSILVRFNKPRALLINAKSKYKLQPNKSKIFLIKILSQIEMGLKILEQRKQIIKSYDDLSQLIVQNNELINFAKQLRLELYQFTKEQKYLQDVITLHESAVYNRIRARLNFKNNIKFSGVPKKILERESFLKENLSNTLSNPKNEGITLFLNANKDFNTFLDSLKLNYPIYYKTRYATLEQSLDNLQQNIPKNTTVIRYLFIKDKLYAFVAAKNKSEIFALNSENVKTFINQLNKGQFQVFEINNQLYELYQKLWQPFATEISTENVIIIPDGVLYNLSFETLTPKKIESLKELTINSLLKKYNISYNYSLLLLDENRKTIDYSNNFIAFVPEFTEKMKNNYKIAITDSLDLDKTYLTLLPQPFSKNLVTEFSQLFNGSSFINENASKYLFTNSAKEHKIIHIGTHAESNNVNPELSRLIFAKNAKDTLSLNDNSLYTYEIYNQNFSSNLAILTACETGKPTYQAGEGMISLAHAFNYAGSESILTSLWKIDEQSSTQIIKLFYDNLSNGVAKHEALRKAKLDYISTAEGRTVSPQYWAGLILIGDTSAIEISTISPNSSISMFLAMALLGLLIYVSIYFKKKIKV